MEEGHGGRSPREAAFYLSESYRLRGDAGDAERAGEWLLKANALTPDYPPVLRASGMAAMRAGQRADAKAFFTSYLQRLPHASDRAFVQSYLTQIEEEGLK